MTIPSNGITPEIIRGAMPPYHLSPDLLAATIAALPAPPPDTTTAWRQARLARLFQEIDDRKPANAAQARMAAQIITTRELADAFTARALTPNLEVNQMCRLGRTAAELLRSADRLDRTLARHQQMPVSFYGTVIQDEVDIPALETLWASGIPASPGTDAPASATAATPTGTTATTPPPATPQPTIAPDLVDPQPTSPTPPQPQTHTESPDPAEPATQPPAARRIRPAGPTSVYELLDQGPGYTREILRRRTATDPLPEPTA
jgi:hypothetical protein